MLRWGGRRITLIPYSTGSIRIFQIVPSEDSGSGGGNISMLGVKNELDEGDYSAGESYTNISLTELSDGTDGTINTTNASSDRPDGSAPHALSEFGNYDHDLAGVTPPTNLAYTAASTTSITFTFTDPTSASRVYFFQGTNASFTTFDGQPMKIDGNTEYIAVDESGTTSLTVNNQNSNDQIFNPTISIYTNIPLSANDFLDISYKGYDGGVYSAMTSDIRGYTLPGSPSSLAVSHARTGGVTAWGDGDDGAYTETITWSAPNGGASSYKVTHGPNSTRDDGANTQDVAVSSGTSLDITGINNNASRYAWVAAVGGGGDTGAYTALGNHQVNEVYYTAMFSGFVIEGSPSSAPGASPSVQQIVYSAEKTFQVVYNSTTTITCDLANNAGNGTLSVSMGLDDPCNTGNFGDAGFNTNGNSNGATGWVTQGTTCTLNGIDTLTDTISVRFRYITHHEAGGYARVATFALTGDGAAFTRTITARTLKSDRRLKTNIVPLGYSEHFQIPIYSFNYKTDLNTTYKGVMAQDLLEMNFNHAIIIDGDGYYNVLYDLIDVDMEILN